MAYFYAVCAVHVTIFSTGGKFCLVSNLHSYTLLLKLLILMRSCDTSGSVQDSGVTPLYLSYLTICMISCFLGTCRRLSDIFRKGRRHFRRTLTRGRSDDQDPRSQIPPLPPHASSTQPAEGKPPSTPPPPSAVVWLVGGRANSGVTNTPSTSGSKASTSEASKPTGEEGGSVTAQVTLTPSAIATGGSGNVKERIQRWIQQQATQFLERWSGMSNQNPALEVVNQLSEAAQQLDLQLSSCASALTVSVRV